MPPPTALSRPQSVGFGVYLPFLHTWKDWRILSSYEGCTKSRPVACVPLILVRCCSSVVEHSIGNGEVDSSILSSSTIFQSGMSGSPISPRTKRCRER